jgi:acetyl esterase/lipase
MLRRIAFTVLLMWLVNTAYGQELDPAVRWATTVFSEWQLTPDIVYKRASGQELKLDVVTPWKQPQVRPTVIFIHGGAWLGSGKAPHLLFLLPYMAWGMNVVNVEYRMSPVALAPAAVEDCRCALYWVFKNAKQYGFDTNKLVVAGESAGGHLSLMTGMIDAGAGFDNECDDPPKISPKVAAIVDYCGITDVADLLEGPHQQWWALRWFGTQPNRAELARRVSPLTYVRPGGPPTVIVHGEADTNVPYEQGVRLHEALNKAGVANEFVTMTGGKHWGWPREQYLKAGQAVLKFLTQQGILSR